MLCISKAHAEFISIHASVRKRPALIASFAELRFYFNPRFREEATPLGTDVSVDFDDFNPRFREEATPERRQAIQHVTVFQSTLP